MIFFVLFCSLFEDILLTKSGKNNKKEQKRSKKIKKDKNHDLFCSFLRTHFDQIGHKNVDFERVLKKNKKEQKRQRTSWVFPGGMIFFVVGPPPHHQGPSEALPLLFEDRVKFTTFKNGRLNTQLIRFVATVI